VGIAVISVDQTGTFWISMTYISTERGAFMLPLPMVVPVRVQRIIIPAPRIPEMVEVRSTILEAAPAFSNP